MAQGLLNDANNVNNATRHHLVFGGFRIKLTYEKYIPGRLLDHWMNASALRGNWRASISVEI
jgi:hypothetical protein